MVAFLQVHQAELLLLLAHLGCFPEVPNACLARSRRNVACRVRTLHQVVTLQCPRVSHGQTSSSGEGMWERS